MHTLYMCPPPGSIMIGRFSRVSSKACSKVSLSVVVKALESPVWSIHGMSARRVPWEVGQGDVLPI